jgi:hypothetical protein
MPSLVIAKTFLERYAELSKSVQNDVRRLLDKFDEMSRGKSLHLESIKGAIDPHVRTIRVNQGIRGIVAAPKAGDTFILIDVLPHDDATQWCRRKRLNINHITGALEIYDVSQLEDTMGAAPKPAAPGPLAPPPGFFSTRANEDFAAVGIDPLLMPAVRALASEDEARALAVKLPPDQGQALLMLAAGYSVDEALAELLTERTMNAVGADAEMAIAAAALNPASAGAFYVVESAAALTEILNAPLDHWRVFLHPGQRRLANREFDGAARVFGGPGTGKTVVALHRALFLAGRLPEARARVLLTTFTKGLASALRQQLTTLDSQAETRVDVENVDAVAYRIVQQAERGKPAIVSAIDLRSHCASVLAEHQLGYPADFLRREWEQVVLAHALNSRDSYFAAPRAGRGIRLNRAARARVWGAIMSLVRRLDDACERTHLQLAQVAAQYVAGGSVQKYTHVIVDEAQDLHPAQWRLLRQLAPAGPNDLFIVGDPHQRIYDNRVTLSSLGIPVRGRSSKLRLNYRTTYEILRWSLGVLEGQKFDDLDGSSDDLRGYRSMMRGPAPVVGGYPTAEAERSALVDAVRGWLTLGIAPAAIGIAARTAAEAKYAADALRLSGVPARDLSGSSVAGEVTADGVSVGTMHSMKGLEFRCVAVVAAHAGLLPHPSALAAADEDPLQHAHDLTRERSLFFVACTRARDALRVSWHGSPSPFVAALVG